MSQAAFERYAPFIQEYIYRKKWTDLREVQVQACSAILDTDDNVIIASGTASGKTEAAFFPILTILDKKPSSSVGVLYIGPLKALINDQFVRLNDLLADSELPVWPWHGDIAQTEKKRALKERRGVVQITPESLESLLMRAKGDVSKLFSDLRFVVIDEIHAFMGTDRGLQLICLLSRLENIAGCNPRRIGLSATLNNYDAAMKFLGAGSNHNNRSVVIGSSNRKVSLCVESFEVPKDLAKAKRVDKEYNEFLYKNCHNTKCLIFTNSRSEAEKTIADMKEIASRRHEPDVFFVHHGSISAQLRGEAESALRDTEGPTVTAATLTLELGIDIGDLDLIIQLGAPYTSSSFVQRLGRSGRRTGKSRMLFVERHSLSVNEGNVLIPWTLLRAIAIIQLYLEEKWVEPFVFKPKPFSVLAHQTLSTLVAYRQLSPPQLAKKVLSLPAFVGSISKEEYQKLLRYMLAKDYIERTEEDEIIIGLEGERLINRRSFYAVFRDEQGYAVYSVRGEVGTLDICPAVGEVFVLGGRSWKVDTVDERQRKVYVSPLKNKNIPTWYGGTGNIDNRVFQKMREILKTDTVYPYLTARAKNVLNQARQQCKNSHLIDSSLISVDDHTFLLCPWVGTKTFRTLKNLLLCGLKDSLRIYDVKEASNILSITTELDKIKFLDVLQSIDVPIEDPDMVLEPERVPKVDKYDTMVPDDLLRVAYLHNEMDVPGAVQVLKSLR